RRAAADRAGLAALLGGHARSGRQGRVRALLHRRRAPDAAGVRHAPAARARRSQEARDPGERRPAARDAAPGARAHVVRDEGRAMTDWAPAERASSADLAARAGAGPPATLGEIWRANWSATGLDTLTGSGQPLEDAFNRLVDVATTRLGPLPAAA